MSKVTIRHVWIFYTCPYRIVSLYFRLFNDAFPAARPLRMFSKGRVIGTDTSWGCRSMRLLKKCPSV